MKKLFLMLIAVATAGYANAQTLSDSNVPAAAKAALSQKYPSIKSVKWEKEGGNYEAVYTLNGTENSAVLNAKGNILETEMGIKPSQLPAQARQNLSEKYPNQKITEAAKITSASGKVTYEAEVKGKDVLFDTNGNFVKQSQEEEDED
ncbi:PepSY-like domain-containing protein [Pontibacter sp. 172403-2]|uniref:PepSY-like domain-containing protein n=1 Tax=Pontibacter rufus TaxID=2791028 RepID=UPI0018AFF12D|nr:PepSY-like domain-containing protein [Pontibacter sp. 172403-2]MBF9252238.1 PepSY-like domain-containing protein [Pontibacter sp. 172403-2]